MSLVCSCDEPLKHQSSKSIEGRDQGAKGGEAVNGKIAGHVSGRGASLKPCIQPHPVPLKSSLKKPTRVGEQQQQQQVMVRDGRRKVNWPDAHGRDLAHIQEFQSSVLEEGKFKGVRGSCICVIQ